MSNFDEVNDYVSRTYHYHVNARQDMNSMPPLINPRIPRALSHQARVAGKRLAEARCNQIVAPWDATCPPVRVEDCSTPMRIQIAPAIVVDSAGRIILWYLPNVLSTEYEDLMWNETAGINNLFRANPPNPRPGTSWRNQARNFLPQQPDHSLHPGCISMSPGWFQRGQTDAGGVDDAQISSVDRAPVAPLAA
ncbi:uncharacterized protein C8Q71DRAFT_721021 [Rhodofomes roseus]|uniref:Uncharacterized protein n=1 Tax=Rhodofomes roseus TaxID=34475 RepID=A0ABQ8KU66_9APHY|nr:uncharacterized protein C8Q71DRAFT_721011 [Rhodofomes roseus]XP_047783279.1 uncharacterized protein C8Q71DRAFT_721021 [Rhodofomes roseus]KAH9841966.1 hypothetical protein C8Q71DRAFT_721011 [Rhodofomes roseus]KAH9841980.1 hypothetical protein C8Q71DRAFT_721021 [Rhodofomes roseus]